MALFVVALALSPGTLTPSVAQESPAQTSPAPGDAAAAARRSLIDSTEELKESTAELIRLGEARVEVAAAQLEQVKGLYADGLVAKIDLERAEAMLAASHSRLDSLRRQLAESDRKIADIEAAERLSKLPPAETPSVATRAPGKYNSTAGLIRYTGKSRWSLVDIAELQAFYSSIFRRPLPISAAGQSATHDRFGYDHRHAVDVALHPDSAEGRALVGYLQSRGIAFIAFRTSIPGVATGPHIHIGRPSNRIY
jgi:hypothetical protein